MKKIALLFAFSITAFVSNAQYTLTGTSYTQNFDGIGGGLPTGWFLYEGATATSAGTTDVTYGSGSPDFGAYWDTTDCASDVFGTGFKNCASADNGWMMSTSTCDTQKVKTNRALGVRQSTSLSGFDPGASFAFEMTNTTMDSDFALTFNLQSLDSMAPRVTDWTLQYGIGASPTTYTTVTGITGTMSTGGNVFANHAISVTLPAAINKQSQPVWLRIVTLSATTGTWVRTTSAIDDFNLTWHTATGSSTAVTNVQGLPTLSLTAIGQSTTDKVTLAYSVVQEGAYQLSIYDITGRMVHTETIHAQAGNETITVTGLYLLPGMYIAKMNNGNSSSVARISVQ